MNQTTAETPQQCPRIAGIAQILALVGGLAWIVAGELPRWQAAAETGKWGLLLVGFNVDTTLPAILFLLLPLFWMWRGRSRPQGNAAPVCPNLVRDVVTCLAVGALSIGMSYSISAKTLDDAGKITFGELPPAYHDEFSYQFQARTYLDGRVAFPGHDRNPEWFSQMHVLTEPTYASRYFPATGLWLAPFEAAGHVYWGQWVCGAVVSIFVFLTGRELGGYLTGLFAGLACALSPGLAIFSNLLLAHHPTMLGLSIFLFFMIRMQRTHSALNGALAGFGLSWAMLCRPMSAAGFALPWGVWLLAIMLRPGKLEGGYRTSWKLGLAVGLPVVMGLAALLAFDRAVTGDALTTPYSLFTEKYTPKHVYGFNNVERGEGQRESEVYRKYDDWATNLTVPVAIENVRDRAISSLVWTWGIVPLTMAGVWMLVSMWRSDMSRWRLILGGIVTMHLAHIPYWYKGIMDWHYVFESALLWLLVLAGASASVIASLRSNGRTGLVVWCVLMLFVPLLPMYFAGGDFWETARVDQAVDSIAFSRLRFREFDRRLAALIGDRRAIALIRHDPTDLHIDYVQNVPTLDSPILRIRSDRGRPTQTELDEIRFAYPDRDIWYFDIATGEHELLIAAK